MLITQQPSILIMLVVIGKNVIVFRIFYYNSAGKNLIYLCILTNKIQVICIILQ